ncbi:hypothetical protein EV126DRAFT_104130 [Verticillium dahliae]|nr:hypothetical protein EV126DRAFT_104130 [Verticillium dahliae]
MSITSGGQTPNRGFSSPCPLCLRWPSVEARFVWLTFPRALEHGCSRSQIPTASYPPLACYTVSPSACNAATLALLKHTSQAGMLGFRRTSSLTQLASPPTAWKPFYQFFSKGLRIPAVPPCTAFAQPAAAPGCSSFRHRERDRLSWYRFAGQGQGSLNACFCAPGTTAPASGVWCLKSRVEDLISLPLLDACMADVNVNLGR